MISQLFYDQSSWLITHNAREKSNRTKFTVDIAKEYLQNVEDRFTTAYKVYCRKLMKDLMSMQYDGSRTMYEHVMDINNISSKLKLGL